jgi:hypothetical protein
VAFVTAHPERLLTGERPEPAFLITKPFTPHLVKAVVSQALCFDVKAHAPNRKAAKELLLRSVSQGSRPPSLAGH